MMYGSNHMTAGGWIFSILGMLIIVGLIVAAVTWLIRGSRGQAVPADSARQLLDRRLASGELSPEEYSQLRAATADQPATTPSEPRPPRPASAPG